MSSSTRKVAKSAVIIVILGLLAKPLGFVREMLMGSKFGSSMETDTYILALAAIGLFSGLLSKTINTTLIPILSEIEQNEGKEGKILHANNFLNLIILFSILLMIIGFIFAPQIVKVLAPGFGRGKQFDLAILLIRIGLPTLIFDASKGVLIGYLQTEGRFKEGAAVGIPLNLAFITYLTFLSQHFGIVGLMATSTLAAIIQLLYVTRGLKNTTYTHSLHIDIHDEYIKKIFMLIPPILISVGISDFNSIVDKSMGSKLVEGSISALNYAEKLGTVVRLIFISAITTVMYPEFAKAANKEDKTQLKSSIITAINLTLLITVPATIGMMLLSTPIVKLAFERNKFDAVATAMTASALIFTALRMASVSIRIILHDVFYSLQNTKVPLYVSIFSVAVNIFFNIILVGPMKHNGLALATTISSVSATVVLVYILRKEIGSVGFMDSVVVGFKTLFASLIMGVIALFTHRYLINMLGVGTMAEIISLGVAVGLGGIIYLGLVHILKVDEFQWFMSSLFSRIKS